MTFRTEKDVETLLQTETRTLNGYYRKVYTFTMHKLYWRSFDIIVRWKHMEPGALIEETIRTHMATGESLDDVFPNVVWSRHDWFHNKLGIDTGLTPPPRPATIWQRPALKHKARS